MRSAATDFSFAGGWSVLRWAAVVESPRPRVGEPEIRRTAVVQSLGSWVFEVWFGLGRRRISMGLGGNEEPSPAQAKLCVFFLTLNPKKNLSPHPKPSRDPTEIGKEEEEKGPSSSSSAQPSKIRRKIKMGKLLPCMPRPLPLPSSNALSSLIASVSSAPQPNPPQDQNPKNPRERNPKPQKPPRPSHPQQAAPKPLHLPFPPSAISALDSIPASSSSAGGSSRHLPPPVLLSPPRPSPADALAFSARVGARSAPPSTPSSPHSCSHPLPPPLPVLSLMSSPRSPPTASSADVAARSLLSSGHPPRQSPSSSTSRGPPDHFT
ncbi:uncharacterized protein A4U43_C03F31460 [Asparagus officinalis]|uniref:Uncharacterized protein n=1 Tax=Asparagus officinalis TaxID=4686 RepID=A0A5P1FF90_ASPOF|nr:uncharacterized protein A4U43_C03F31460 [Asparagus officinalis]